MNKALFAMSTGTLCLGIAEFIMPGVLSFVANDFDISITKAGHLISAYALGVCVGAPIILLAMEKVRLKTTLLFCACLILMGNLLAGLSPNYICMMASRFLSGLPHGAYFGIASIIVSKIAPKGKESFAMSIMILGMTIANVVGIPLGTFLSNNLSWRLIFFAIAALSFLILIFVKINVPDLDNDITPKISDRVKFLKHGAPWLILLGTMFGNCAIFCMYSYINPILTQVAGFKVSSLTILMVVSGLGMVLGNILGGKFSDKFAPGIVASMTQVLATIMLFMMFLFADNSILCVVIMFLSALCLFALGSPQQLLIIKYSAGGQKLGAACIQLAFNFGNAVGAYLGGIPIENNYSCNYSALVGVPLCLIGALSHYYFHYRYEKNKI